MNGRRLEDILKLLIGLVVLILINLISSRYFHRFDLTEEGRYSIKPATKELLNELDDVVYVEVYLDGELNSGFKRLQRVIRETLEEFRVYSGDNIQYTFNDPLVALGEKAKGQFMRQLAEKGIQPTNVIDDQNGQQVQKLIFPGAIVSYGGREEGVMLLSGNQMSSAEEKLNQSIEGVEYELASVIYKMTSLERKRVAILSGHGELSDVDLAGFRSAMEDTYDVFDVKISGSDLKKYDALIVAKPTLSFSEQDKYYLDQYIMNGGKLMLLIDNLQANMDSASSENNFAFPYNLNLDDQLFNYGVRVNPNLIQDNVAAGYPVSTGSEIKLMKWPFYPIFNRFADHPITTNLDGVLGQFVSTIDTVKAIGVRKTPLIFTSDYSRSITTPVKVAITDLQKNLSPEMLNKSNLPMAYLLEGTFESLYKNRFKPEGVDESGFVDSAPKSSKILVVSDGDIARNEVDPKSGKPQQLGFYPFANSVFANQDFLMNSLAYMVEEEGLITARSKEILIRPLDKVKINRERLKWQIINLAVPVLLLIGYGIVRYYLRKRKYTGFETE